MRGALLLIALLGLAYAGVGLLALSQPRNRAVVAVSAPLHGHGSLALRLAGSFLLAVSLVVAIARDGPAFGTILWTAMLTVAGWLVVLTLILLRGRARR